MWFKPEYYILGTSKKIQKVKPMTETKERHRALIGIRDDIISKLQKQAPELASQLNVILGLIDEYTPVNGNEVVQPVKADDRQQIIFKLLRPVQVVKKLFKDNPDKIFTPPELRDQLQHLKNSGGLIHRGKNMLTTTHTTLRLLQEQNYIELIV